jgi:hypothetical protein
MTPLCKSQGCQWLRCACYSGANDSAVQVTAVSMTPLCISQQWHLLRCTMCSQIIIPYKKKLCLASFSKIFNKVGCTAESLTPLWHAQRSHWHHCDMYNCVIDTAVTRHWHLCATNFVDFLRKYKAIFKKALTRVSGAYRGSCLMKKQRSKSRVRVALNSVFLLKNISYIQNKPLAYNKELCLIVLYFQRPWPHSDRFAACPKLLYSIYPTVNDPNVYLGTF